MMVQQSAIPRSLGVESELYCQNWRSLGTLESSRLDQKVRAAGWNLFFMVGELRAVAPAWGGQNSLRRGVKRLLAQTQLQHFNCLELGHILRKRFLGIPGCQMQSVEQRAQSGADALERRSSSGDTPEGLNIEGCLQN